MTDLLRDTVELFDLDMIVFDKGIKFGEGLQILVDTNRPPFAGPFPRGRPEPVGPPHPMAFVLGTRGSDPNAGSQGKFAPSSHYMPAFMRVNPVLDWSYGQIWHFLRLFQLPYCNLYDLGYTSLGTVNDTLPCPALAKPVVEGESGGYWPAYMLRDWDQERAGRIAKTKKGKEPITISQSSSTVSLVDRVAAAGADGHGGKDDDDDDDSIASSAAQRTVGLIVIGDEILKGLTTDTNTHFAATALRERNVPLSRITIVSDDRDEIAAEIKRMQSEVDVIITSGGVGPTHDDVTMKSVAAALGQKLVLHEGMARLLREKMQSDAAEGGRKGEDEEWGNAEEPLSEAQIKMATLPAGSRLRYLTREENEWPVLQCRNIFVLPGVPQFFEKKAKDLAAHLSSEQERSAAYKVVLSVDETSIVDVLNSVVRRHPNVSFGSYPFVGHPQTKTVVTLEGRLIEGGYTRNSGRYLNRTQSKGGKAVGGGGERSTTVPPAPLLFTKEQMDRSVRAALTDLLNGLPEGSVLRVDNDDDLTFC